MLVCDFYNKCSWALCGNTVENVALDLRVVGHFWLGCQKWSACTLLCLVCAMHHTDIITVNAVVADHHT